LTPPLLLLLIDLAEEEEEEEREETGGVGRVEGKPRIIRYSAEFVPLTC
jgi:hypothetical protein